MKKKKYVFLVVLLLIVFFRFLLFLPVKRAISYEEAKQIADNNDNYYIVFDQRYMEQTYFMIFYGELAEKGVIIEPLLEEEFSNAFNYPSRNIFLIQAKSIEEYRGEQPYPEDGPIDYKIIMDDWEIVAPIERDYNYTFSMRFNPPENHIDLLDVMFGDYRPKLLRNLFSS